MSISFFTLFSDAMTRNAPCRKPALFSFSSASAVERGEFLLAEGVEAHQVELLFFVELDFDLDGFDELQRSEGREHLLADFHATMNAVEDGDDTLQVATVASLGQEDRLAFR